MRYPDSREELEAMFADGDVAGFTRAEMVRMARDYLGLRTMAGFMRRSELAEHFRDPDIRPTIQAKVEARMAIAAKKRKERDSVIAEGLNLRRGRFRFNVVAVIENALFVDDISGLEADNGFVVRDSRNGERLKVSKTTVSKMKGRKQVAWFDKQRLPLVPRVRTTTQISPHGHVLEVFRPGTLVSVHDHDVEQLLRDLEKKATNRRTQPAKGEE